MDDKPRNRRERRALERRNGTLKPESRRKDPWGNPVGLPHRSPKMVKAGSGEPSYPGDTIVFTGFDDPNWF